VKQKTNDSHLIIFFYLLMSHYIRLVTHYIEIVLFVSYVGHLHHFIAAFFVSLYFLDLTGCYIIFLLLFLFFVWNLIWIKKEKIFTRIIQYSEKDEWIYLNNLELYYVCSYREIFFCFLIFLTYIFYLNIEGNVIMEVFSFFFISN
jgi:hypothetical protein